MGALSDRHHEVPRWLLSHFTTGNRGRLWIGFKDDGRIHQVSLRNAFVRRGANSRVDYVPRPDGSFARVKSDEAERHLAAFDSLACDAARELIETARRGRHARLAAAELSPQMVAICKRLILVQLRRTREAQERIDVGEHDPVLIADVLRDIAVELGEPMPCTEELVEDPATAGVFEDISQNNRATFAGGQHPLDLQKDAELLAQRGLRIALVNASNGDLVIGSHGITAGRTLSGREFWLPIAPDVAISHSNAPSDVTIEVMPRAFIEWHNRAAVSISERVAGCREETLRVLLAAMA